MTEKSIHVYVIGVSQERETELRVQLTKRGIFRLFMDIEALFKALACIEEGLVILGPHLVWDEALTLCASLGRQTQGRNFRILVATDNSSKIQQALANGAHDVISEETSFGMRVEVGLSNIEQQRQGRIDTERLRTDTHRLQQATDFADCGMWHWNLQTNEVWFSARWKSILGLSRTTEYQLTDWLDRVHPHDASALKKAISVHQKGESEYLGIEFRMRHKEGDWRWFYCRGEASRTPDGDTVSISGSLTDVTERRNAEEQVLRGTFYDQITELPNRALVRDRVWCALERSKRDNSSAVGLLHLELDRFRLINTSLGHDMGNLLLQAVAKRLQSCMRYCHSVARIGDDEFAVLLEEMPGPREALLVARRIQEQFSNAFVLGERDVFVGVRIGIAVSAAVHQTPDDLLRDAETALRRARNSLVERVQIFDPLMQEKARQRLTLETELRHAVSKNQLLLHYQPVVDLQSESVRGFEALLRWNHPDGRVLGVGDFFSVAEESGMVVPIGYWVLEQSCAQLKEWHLQSSANEHLAVGINLSVKQLLHCELPVRIEETLARYHLQPRHLWVEVTERAFASDPASARTQLERLKALGIRIAYDDFGGEGSTISHLDSMPIDELKLAHGFAERMRLGAGRNGLVKSVVNMASELGMALVVKGMETQVQCDHVREIQGALAQGYFLSKPLSPDAITAFLQLEPEQLIASQDQDSSRYDA